VRRPGRVVPNADARGAARQARALHLAAAVPAAADLLTFYAALAGWHSSLAAADAARDAGGSTLAAAVDRAAVVAAIPALIEWLPGHAPAELAGAAVSLQQMSLSAWRQRLDAFVDDGDDGRDPDPHAAFVVEAALLPFAEHAVSRANLPALDRPASTSECPFCGRRPALASLREAGDGAKRGLICGVCACEWRAPRIGCASCGESTVEKLPVFSAEGLSAVRVEACETCRAYLKSIDFTRDGHAEPVVDDLATLALDLWAREQGYRRLRPHLLRV
jgi:formate dehydrogenase accessory protein FdhE